MYCKFKYYTGFPNSHQYQCKDHIFLPIECNRENTLFFIGSSLYFIPALIEESGRRISCPRPHLLCDL